MNIWAALGERKFAVWGAGDCGRRVAERFSDRVVFFVDSDKNKWGTNFCGKEIKNSQILKNSDYFVVVASEKYYFEIARTLDSYGLKKGYDYAIFLLLFGEKEFADRYPLLDITFGVCDICNSKCTMCFIWKNKNKHILPLKDFTRFISDEYLINVRNLIVTGGEPTLVANLDDYIKAAVSSLPSLTSVILNMNCLLVDKTIEIVKSINNICKDSGVSIRMNFSINGVGEVHDITRGVPGNFERVMRVWEGLRNLNDKNISFYVSARIVKSNVFDQEELVYFLKKNNLCSNEIYPAGIVPWFDNANMMEMLSGKDEQYQIDLLAYKISAVFNDPFQELLQIHNFHKRNNGVDLAECRRAKGYHMSIIANGKNLWCNAYSGELEAQSCNNLEEVYKKNYESLRFIEKVNCKACISCMCIEPTPKYLDYKETGTYWQNFYTPTFYFANYGMCSESLKTPDNQRPFYTVLITGWYGTETVGDKAILGQIISEVRAANANAQIQVTSMFPFVTGRTLYELGEAAEIIPVEKEALYAAALADEVIMGGGPLMEIDCLGIPLWLFSIAKQAGHKTVVRGCGIGPVKTEKGEKAVAEILSLADEITVRDSASAEIARKMTGRDDITVTGDPAIPYLKANHGGAAKGGKSGILACFLREITDEYYSGTHEEYLCFRAKFEKALALNIKKLCEEKNLRPYFYSMHNFVIGGDDRDFAYRFVDEQGFEKGSYDIYNKLTSIDVVVDAMLNADLCLCMRFHSTVFADTLGVPYISIDYTNGGKIKGFLDDNGKHGLMVTIEDIMNSTSLLIEKAVTIND